MPRPKKFGIADLLQATAQMVMVGTMLEYERQVMVLRAYPWIAELHWRITLRLHELADEEERLVQARELLLGERKRPYLVELEPPRRPVAPSETIDRAAAGIARAISAVMGE